MQFILYTTGRCNLSCKYCGGSFDPSIVPWRVEYRIGLLDDLIKSGDVVAFYGGEPLLNIAFMKDVVERFPDARFVVQTNGLLLDRLSPRLLDSLSTILISIDGREAVTDMYRGKGVYRKVLNSVSAVRAKGFEGELVARMTLTCHSDVFSDVMHLLDIGIFDSVHWQLSFVWVPIESWPDLWQWIRESYMTGLRRLFGEWLARLEQGELLGIVPFRGILKRVLRGGPIPPCGSGIESFTILTDGRVVSCPIAVSERWAFVGRLGNVSRSDIEKRKPIVEEPCKSCERLRTCGTRCLYTHLERLWGIEGVEAVCECSKFIIDLIENNLERIMSATSRSRLRLEDLLYPEYNNTVEIMP